VESLDLFPSAASSCSAVKTPDPQSLGTSACLVETEVTLENTEGDPNAPATAAEGDIQMDTPLISCASQNIGSVTKKLHARLIYVLSDHLEYLIIGHCCVSTSARLKEFYCNYFECFIKCN